MQFRELSRAEYLAAIRRVIVGSEGLHAHAQNVGDGRATIGYGYTFNRNDNTAIWRDSGIELSDEQWRVLRQIDRAPANQKTALGLAFTRRLNAAESEQLLEASISRYEGPANRLNMPLSEERVAVVSIAYNRGTGALGQSPLMDAVAQGDRAESWYQMRYNCWGTAANSEAGLRKRRIAEAQVFGLYDDPDNVTPEEAMSVYRMFQLHREHIDQVERQWGQTIDGDPGTRNLINMANRDYPTLNAAYGPAPTIAEALVPARTALLSHLRQEYPALAREFSEENFLTGRIHVDPGRELRNGPGLSSEQRNAASGPVQPDHDFRIDATHMRRGQEVEARDILIGNRGHDTLLGGRGDDILIGGSGADQLEGGVGNDTYVVGAGDTVRDTDGRGRVFWGQQEITGGQYRSGDPEGTYRSSDGNFSFQMDGDVLWVSNAAGESFNIHGFRSGALGIELTGGPRRTEAVSTGENQWEASSAPHPLLEQARSAVERLDQRMGRTPDHASACMAASVACLAQDAGLRRIDHVVLSADTDRHRAGETVFVVQGSPDDPAHQRAQMPISVAVSTSVSASMQKLDQSGNEARRHVNERSELMARQDLAQEPLQRSIS